MTASNAARKKAVSETCMLSPLLNRTPPVCPLPPAGAAAATVLHAAADAPSIPLSWPGDAAWLIRCHYLPHAGAAVVVHLAPSVGPHPKHGPLQRQTGSKCAMHITKSAARPSQTLTFLGDRPRGPILGAREDAAPTSPPVARTYTCGQAAAGRIRQCIHSCTATAAAPERMPLGCAFGRSPYGVTRRRLLAVPRCA